MKKLILSLCSAFLFTISFAQLKSGDAQLDKRLEEYCIYNVKQDYKNLVEYYHSSIFKIVPKQTMLKSLQANANDESFKLSYDTMRITAISPVFKVDSAAYHKVTFYSYFTMSVADEESVKDEDFTKSLIGTFQAFYPGKSVSYSKEKNLFIVAGEENMIAVKDTENPEWTFLGYNEYQEDVIKNVLPEEVFNHFKN
ncbi:MAG TPA: hypothetical protein VGD26_10135 [Chitinophagaceae bacterium]